MEPVDLEFRIPESFGVELDKAIKKMSSMTRVSDIAVKDARAAVREQKNVIKQIEKDIANIEKEAGKVINLAAKREITQELSAAKRILQEEKSALVEKEKILESQIQTNKHMSVTVRELKDEMYKLAAAGKENSKEYSLLESELVKLQKSMQHVDKTSSNLSNTQKSIKGVVDGVSGLSAALSAAGGAAGLFSGENENLIKIQTKLQSLMAITIGLQQVSNSLDKKSAFMSVTVAKAKQMWTTSQKALTKALWGSSVAAKALMGTLTLGLSVAIPALISLISRLKSETGKAAAEQKKLRESVIDSTTEPIVQFRKLQKQWESLGDSLKAKQKFISENKDEFRGLGTEVNNVNDAENLFVKSSEAFVKAMNLRAKAAAHQQLAVEKYKESLEESDKATGLAQQSAVWNVLGNNAPGFGLVGHAVGSVQEQRSKKASVRSAKSKAESDRHTNVAMELEKEASKLLEEAGIKTPQKNTSRDSSKTKETYESQIANIKKYYELYKKAVELGQTEIAEVFKKQLPKDFTSYEDYINSEMEKAKADKNTEKLTVLMPESEDIRSKLQELLSEFKSYDEQRVDIEKKYNEKISIYTKLGLDDKAKLAKEARDKELKELDNEQPLAILREKYKTYSAQIKEITEESQNEIKTLKENGYLEEAQMAQDMLDQKVEQLTIEKLKSMEVWEALFQDMSDLTAVQMQNIVDIATQKMSELQGSLSNVDVSVLNKMLEDINAKIAGKSTKKGGVNNPFTGLIKSLKAYNKAADDSVKKAQAFEDVMKYTKESVGLVKTQLSSVVDTMQSLGAVSSEEAGGINETIGQVAGVMEGAGDIAAGMASSNPAQMIQGAIKVIGNMSELLDFRGKEIAKRQNQLTSEIAEIEQSYKKLEHAVSTAVGSDVYAKQREQIALNIAQIARYEELIWLENDKKQKKRNQDAINEWRDAITQLRIANEDIISNIAETMLQTNVKSLADELANTLANAFESGTNAAVEFGDIANEVIKKVILNAIKMEIIEKKLKPVIDKLVDDLDNDKDGKIDLTKKEADEFKRKVEEIGAHAGEAFREMNSLFDDIFGQSSGMASMAKETFGSMNQETASELLGQFTALRVNSATISNIINEERDMRLEIAANIAEVAVNSRYLTKLLNIEKSLTNLETQGISIRS